MASSDRFGFEWNKYSTIDPNYESQLKNWIFPLGPQEFKNKTVLDAGCGMGRNSYWCLEWGAKKVVAFDFDSRSVTAAKNNLNPFENAEVLFKSIYEIDWSDTFDLAFSIGVIHHLNDPKRALKNLVTALKKEGTLIIWLYSYEGNEWIYHYINPIRIHLTSKLPVRMVHFLSYFCSIPLWCFIKLFRGPSSYLKQLSTFKFWHVHSIVFDQLIPEVANYWKKEEIQQLFSELNLTSYEIFQPPNGSGWTVIGKK
ncbi:MAG: class I SAM-dependent methyltransferase [Planctomycetota bacterium]